MHILRSWYDSLTLLLPSQLKLFGLVSLLSTGKTYRVLCRQWIFWCLVAGMAVWGYLDQVMIQPYWCMVFTSGIECFFKKFIWHFFSFMLAMTLVVLTCAATRPSIGLKNTNYFKALARHAALILMSIVVVQLIGYLCMALAGVWLMNLTSVILVSDWAKTASVLYVLFALFVFDTDSKSVALFQSVQRTAIMVLYNLPLIIVLNLIMQAAEMGLYLLLAFVNLDTQFFAWYILWLGMMPFIVNIWANLYIKKIHEHPDLYFVIPK